MVRGRLINSIYLRMSLSCMIVYYVARVFKNRLNISCVRVCCKYVQDSNLYTALNIIMLLCGHWKVGGADVCEGTIDYHNYCDTITTTQMYYIAATMELLLVCCPCLNVRFRFFRILYTKSLSWEADDTNEKA